MKLHNNKGRLYYAGKCKTLKLNNIEYINLNFTDDQIINDEIIYDIYIDHNIYNKIKKEYIIMKYNENVKKYMKKKMFNSKETAIKNNNDYLYSELKWHYLLVELDNFTIINKKLPPKDNIIYDKINNFIDYNENNIHIYTEKWKKYKDINKNIFENL